MFIYFSTLFKHENIESQGISKELRAIIFFQPFIFTAASWYDSYIASNTKLPGSQRGDVLGKR